MRENYHLHRLFLILSLICTTQIVQAAHLIGGEITYSCLGFTNGDPNSNSNTYEFTINVFRDCQSGGSEFDSPTFIVNMHITVYQGNNQYGVYYLDAPVVEEVNIEENIGNPCIVVPSNVCVEQGTYTFELDLPIVTDSYHIVYQRCCRNNTIDNILSPESSGTTYTIELTPEAQTSCNSSPQFQEYPPAIICAGQPFSYDFSATDADGDQLVYEFCSPYLGGGNSGGSGSSNGVAPDPDLPPPFDNVIFLAPTYTSTNPLGDAAGFVLDDATGLMTGMPQFTGQFVVGVCVSEYRNGVLLSTVRRDFQFNVTNCEITVFAEIDRDSIIAGDIYVVSSCGETEVTLTNQSGLPSFIDSYQWLFPLGVNQIESTERDLTYDFPGVGTYEGIMVVNPGSTGCTDTAQVLVNIYPGLESEFSFDYDTCVADVVTFTNLSTTLGSQAIIANQWRYGDGNAEDILQNNHLYLNPGAYNVELEVRDQNGCVDISSQLLPYFPVPDLIVIAPSEFRGCVPAEIFFDNLSSPINESYLFDWDFGDGNFGGDLSPTHLYETPGLYSVSLAITSPLGCTTDTSFTDLILMEPAPTPGFSFTPDFLTNFSPELQILDESIGSFRWFYDFNGEATSLLPSPSYVFQDTGQAYITQVVTHPSGCVDSLTQFIDIKPEITFYFPNAFTPNGDGLNDIFKPKGFTRGFKRYSMKVWNRWGEPLFTTSDPLNGWNGQKNNTGRDQPPGVYMYESVLIGPRGEKFDYKGVITLIR
ncbi:PKD domain-containing protein [Lewinella sp. LCG006]|uniref:PKD domain-containing protein n=1 Tax=Lewinella sp. LCG006 TaxID=3231911 RepID=UPI003460DAFE